MKTKLLALLLMLAMIVGVLASCGGNGENDDENGPEKAAFTTWEKAFDLTNATIEYKKGDTTTKYWAIDEVCYTENADGAFEEVEISFDDLTNVLKTKAFYDAATIGNDKKYTVASFTIAGTAATDIVIVLNGKVVSSVSYKVGGETITLTATRVGTTDKPTHDRTKTYYWEENQSILIEMNLDSSNGELTDLTKRYMAGMADEGQVLNSRLDQLVYDRNTTAYTATNMTVNYVFVEDGTYDWNKYHGPISNAIAAPTEDTPDVYCGLAWDLGAAAAKGCFTNLKSTTRGQGNNYFTFNEDNYNAEIIANVADAIFHIIDKLEMNKDAKGNVLLPEKAVEEMYEILYENAEATFYTGTATVDGKTVSNYSIYGTFKQYLIDTRTEEGATTKLTFDEACDRVRDDARQFVERAVKIYYVANVYGLLISDKDYKELTYDDGNYNYYVGSYGDIGFKLAYQFNDLFTELLYVDGEKAAIEAYKTALESDPDAKYDFEIEYVDGKIKFDNVTYTIITED